MSETLDQTNETQNTEEEYGLILDENVSLDALARQISEEMPQTD